MRRNSTPGITDGPHALLQSKDGHVEACRGTQRKHDKNIPTIAQFLPRKSEIHSDLTVSSISRAYMLLNVSIIAPSR